MLTTKILIIELFHVVLIIYEVYYL